VGIFTCDEAIGADATDLFNFLTGYSALQSYKKLLVAPVNLRQRLEALIQREIDHARKGMKAHLILKTNAIVDQPMIELLYTASQAGVQLDLLVRGICCLRPGIKGISENIRVTSVVGRFLEHSRIYYFYNGGREEVYLGSADLMTRNLNHRVEVVFPVENKAHIQYLRNEVLETYLKDNTRSRLMRPNGEYARLQPEEKGEAIDIQQWMMEHRGKMNTSIRDDKKKSKHKA
jgi:polyphosphate kinase